VRILLGVRRLLCDRLTCSRRTFTERLESAPPHAHTTSRLARAQLDAGLALGGAAGSRLLTKQGMPTSRNTLLRRIRALPVPDSVPLPEVIGIDDWAQRRGQVYGTLIVDLERHRPVDLLPERSASVVATWLGAQPQVRVVSRDRSEEYAAGIRQGAPTAVEVADRWHLLQNVREAVEVELQQRPSLPWPPPTVETLTRAPGSRAGPQPIYARTPSGQRADAARLTTRAKLSHNMVHAYLP
jgi:transposase